MVFCCGGPSRLIKGPKDNSPEGEKRKVKRNKTSLMDNGEKVTYVLFYF